MTSALDLDRALSIRLKEVRDEQPQRELAHVTTVRRIVFRRLRNRRIWKSFSGALAATAVMLLALTMPSGLGSQWEPRPREPRSTVADAVVTIGSADPWVVASAADAGIEGDGWIPRRWAP